MMAKKRFSCPHFERRSSSSDCSNDSFEKATEFLSTWLQKSSSTSSIPPRGRSRGEYAWSPPDINSPTYLGPPSQRRISFPGTGHKHLLRRRRSLSQNSRSSSPQSVCYTPDDDSQEEIHNDCRRSKSLSNAPRNSAEATLSPLDRRRRSEPRVSFSDALGAANWKQEKDSLSSTDTDSPTIKVISLPWTDYRGIQGHYTGEVNALIQPHGSGTILLKDGTAFTSIWLNGMPSANVPRGIRKAPTYRRTQSDPIKQLGKSPSESFPRRVKMTHPDYELGDCGRLKDMVIERDPDLAVKKVNTLQTHDFAFVRRSAGQWTYAIIANRPCQSGPNASIRFVVNKKGSTKTYSREHWAKYIRLVKTRQSNEEDTITEELESPVEPYRIPSRQSRRDKHVTKKNSRNRRNIDSRHNFMKHEKFDLGLDNLHL